MKRDILVYAEFSDNRVHPVTYELIAKGRELIERLGGSVVAVIIGYRASNYAEELVWRGSDRVYVYEYQEPYPPNLLLHRDIVLEVIEEIKPKLVLFGATPWGRSLAPRIAAALKTGLTADCLDVYIDDNGDVVQVRPAFTGNIIAHIKTLTEPVLTTIRYRVFKPLDLDKNRKGEVIIRRVSIDRLSRDYGVEVLGKVRDKEVSIADAEIIVAGGRGLKRKEDLAILKELANLLGGVIGVSRPLVDAGWISKEYQVGFSGNIVKPKIYIACGISGAPQHLAGMKDSKIVVSINIDPSAPIVKHSDLFIVGDIYEIIPRIIEELKKLKKGS